MKALKNFLIGFAFVAISIGVWVAIVLTFGEIIEHALLKEVLTGLAVLICIYLISLSRGGNKESDYNQILDK